MGPGRTMLLAEMKVGIGHFFWEHQPVMFLTFGFSQFLELLFPKHSAECVRRIDCAVNENMSDVDAPGRKLRVQGLTKHATSTHSSRVRMLASITPHGRGS